MARLFGFRRKPNPKVVEQLERGIRELLEMLSRSNRKTNPDRKGKTELKVVPTEKTESDQSKARRRQRKQNCCRPTKFLTHWPVNSKKVSVRKNLGWNDWKKKFNGKQVRNFEVIFNRGFIFQLEVTKGICNGLEYKCKDNSGIIEQEYQWADGLYRTNCDMIEVKYAVEESTYTESNAHIKNTPTRQKIHRQFKRYGIICNDPRRVPELPCLKEVGLRVYVNWHTMVGYYKAIMSMYDVPGPEPRSRTPYYYLQRPVPSGDSKEGVDFSKLKELDVDFLDE